MALTAPSSTRVVLAPPPEKTAPSMTNMEAMTAAVRKRTILVPTAVPKMLAASLAPNDHPRNRPLLKKIKKE